MATVLDEAPRTQAGAVVVAELNYLARGESRPVSYTFEPPAGTPWTTGELEPTRVTIRDARPLAASGA